MRLPVWDGRAETLEEYVGTVELLVLGTHADSRVLLGTRLVAARPHGSAQRKLAVRLPSTTGESEDECEASIATELWAENLIQAF